MARIKMEFLTNQKLDDSGKREVARDLEGDIIELIKRSYPELVYNGYKWQLKK
jgi:hypothetical protein